MATSVGTAVPSVVFYRVHREGAIARVRVFVGLDTTDCVGDLSLRPSEFKVWRASLREHDTSRMSLWFDSNKTADWLDGQQIDESAEVREMGGTS